MGKGPSREQGAGRTARVPRARNAEVRCTASRARVGYVQPRQETSESPRGERARRWLTMTTSTMIPEHAMYGTMMNCVRF
jgi:hypothetical protein